MPLPAHRVVTRVLVVRITFLTASRWQRVVANGLVTAAAQQWPAQITVAPAVPQPVVVKRLPAALVGCMSTVAAVWTIVVRPAGRPQLKVAARVRQV